MMVKQDCILCRRVEGLTISTSIKMCINEFMDAFYKSAGAFCIEIRAIEIMLAVFVSIHYKAKLFIPQV